jgi:hypothetical protein
MRLMGSSALAVPDVTQACEEAAFAGRPFFAWCDGEDCTAIVGEEGESADVVLKQARRIVQELA